MKILPKIDIHVHSRLDPVTFLRVSDYTYALPEELRTIYRQHGIERGLLLPSPWEISMRETRQMVRDNPDVFGWWFCVFDPMIYFNDPGRDLTDQLRLYKALGARGIGEFTYNYYLDEPCMLNLLRYAEREDMPFFFHIGDKGHGYGVVDDFGLPRLEKVLQMFPTLTFIGHSQRFWSEISGDVRQEQRGGYPKGKVTPGGRVVELMRKYPNLCGDLSAGSGFNAVTRDPDFGCAFLEEFQDRLFYGSDISDPRPERCDMLALIGWLDDAMLQGRISYAAYEKISRGNALALLEK